MSAIRNAKPRGSQLTAKPKPRQNHLSHAKLGPKRRKETHRHDSENVEKENGQKGIDEAEIKDGNREDTDRERRNHHVGSAPLLSTVSDDDSLRLMSNRRTIVPTFNVDLSVLSSSGTRSMPRCSTPNRPARRCNLAYRVLPVTNDSPWTAPDASGTTMDRCFSPSPTDRGSG